MAACDHVAVQALVLSDDDGARGARVTAEQFARWVEFANGAFRDAGIGFAFDVKADLGELRCTVLNDMCGSGAAGWPAVRALGNRIAWRYPGRLVAFVRHGRGHAATGSAFAGIDHDFVVMGGFEDMNHCGHPHVDALAHEIGHYLGLAHTFVGEPFADIDAAAAFLAAHGGDPLSFDGDGFSDTPPDPAIRQFECERRHAVELLGQTFVLPRRNLMSYYDERDSLSPQQVERARWILARRRANQMRLPVNVRCGVRVLEAESLRITSAHGCEPSTQTMDGYAAGLWSGDAQLFCAARADAVLTLELPVQEAGCYQLVLLATLAPDFATLRCRLDDQPCGAAVDLYAPMVLPTGPISLGPVMLTRGTRRLSFRVEGRHACSRGWHFGIDAIELAR